jgi:hypothetical protein
MKTERVKARKDYCTEPDIQPMVGSNIPLVSKLEILNKYRYSSIEGTQTLPYMQIHDVEEN